MTLSGRHRLGQRLGGAEGHAKRQTGHGSHQLRDLASRRRSGCSTSACMARCSATRRGQGTPEQRKLMVTAPENVKRMLILNEEQAALYSREIRDRLEPHCSSADAAISTARLRPLLAPRSIAFVGASARPDTPGNDMLRMIRRGGFTGSVLGGAPDAARSRATPASRALPICRRRPISPCCRCATNGWRRRSPRPSRSGARAAVIFASGMLAGDAIAAACAAGSAAMAGDHADLRPELHGLLQRPRPGLDLRLPQPAAAGARLDRASSPIPAASSARWRITIRGCASPSPSRRGRKLTATVADYIDYAVERPEVQVIGLFLEAARDPGGLRRALADAAAARRSGGRAEGRPHRSGRRRGAHPYRRARRQRPRVGRAVRPCRRHPGRDAGRAGVHAAAARHGTPRRLPGGLVAIQRFRRRTRADSSTLPTASACRSRRSPRRPRLRIAARLEPGLAPPIRSTPGGAARISSRCSPLASATCWPIRDAALGLLLRRSPRRLLSASRLRRRRARRGRKHRQARRRVDQLHAGPP